MRKSIKILGIVGLIFAQGCYCISERDSAIAMVQDLGPRLSTRNKYMVSCIYEGNTTKTLKTNLDFFSQYQPDVFAVGGHPVVVRVMFDKMDSGNYVWTFFFCCVIPFVQDNASTFLCAVEFPDETAGKSSFKMERRCESATTFMHPGAFFMYNGSPVIDGGVVFSKNITRTGEGPDCGHSFSGYDYLLDSSLLKEALAYATAVKLKELEASGKVDTVVRNEEKPSSPDSVHNVVRLERDSKRNYSYSFEIELSQMSSDWKAVGKAALEEFTESLKEDYCDTYPGVDAGALVVSFSNLKRSGSRIGGSADVLTIKPVSLEYDSNMRRGKLSVVFAERQEAEARAWIKRNIKTLVKDKNIALAADQLTQVTDYRLINESVSGNVMEVHFMTE